MPPEFLHTYAKVEWGRVVDRLFKLGTMSEIDVAALAAYCQYYARWRDAEEAINEVREANPKGRGLVWQTLPGKGGKGGGNMVQNPLIGVANTASNLMLKAAAEFGMTPSARSRIDTDVAARAQEQDDTAEFFKRKK